MIEDNLRTQNTKLLKNVAILFSFYLERNYTLPKIEQQDDDCFVNLNFKYVLLCILQVFKGCGPPQLGRRKREAVRGELTPEFLDFRSTDRQDKKRERETDTVSVSRHVHEIKTKVRNRLCYLGSVPCQC